MVICIDSLPHLGIYVGISTLMPDVKEVDTMILGCPTGWAGRSHTPISL